MTQCVQKFKGLVEHYCRRINKDLRHPGDINVVMRILASMTPQKIFVCVDSSVFAQDFAHAIDKRCYHVRDIQQLQGLEDFTLIFLGTSNKNAARLEDFAKTRRGVDIWHIDDWR